MEKQSNKKQNTLANEKTRNKEILEGYVQRTFEKRLQQLDEKDLADAIRTLLQEDETGKILH